MTRHFIFKILKCLIILLLPLLFTQDTKGIISDIGGTSQTPAILLIPDESSLELECKEYETLEPTIVWTRNNKKIERAWGEVIYKKWSIQLVNFISADSGLYKGSICHSTHYCYECPSYAIAYFNKSDPPYIDKERLRNQTVVRNRNISLSCYVVNRDKSYYIWVKHRASNKSIHFLEWSLMDRITWKKVGGGVILNSETFYGPNISISNVSHSDEGWYSCVTGNSAGRSIASAYLRVVDGVVKDMDEQLKVTHPGWVTIAAIAVVVIIFVGTIYIVYLKQKQQRPEAWIKAVTIVVPASDESCGDLQIPDVKIVKQRTALTANPNKDPSIEFSEYDFPLDCNWEIPRSQVSLASTLGEGAFGRVVMAQVSLATTTTTVAVKMIKDDYSDADVISLVREMELMKIIGSHKNIINLLGCCSQNGPLWVIVEFARHGNLKDFLKNNLPSCLVKGIHLTAKHLTTFAWQIAQGMEYLASKRCIHRDLAARNVLVSDDYIMKIADFGLARDIHESDYYRKYTNGRLPIKWMAPESLQAQFYNSQSDVWSYGVLLWEIMSYGDQPYPNIMSADELYSYLISGKRMKIPKGCSLNIYNLMLQCWHLDSNARPLFADIVKMLDEIIQLMSITFNTSYVNLPEPVLNKEEDDDDGQKTLESDSVSYTPMFRVSK